jgi:hypothetical protein
MTLLGGLRGLGRRLLRPGLVRAVAGASASRHALLLYTVRAFTDTDPGVRHQNVAQQRELARALDELGYEVDAAAFDETRSRLLPHAYDLVVDLHPRSDTLYRDHLRPGALRIAYLTGSRPAFSDAAERERLDDLERRRGVRLRPRRQVGRFEDEVLAGYDACFYFGESTTFSTYDGVRLPPSYALPNSGYEVEPTDPALRDGRRFLFLGSVGQVHKGLDLLLELFASEPGLRLEVCADLSREPDFARAYRGELTATPNIHVHGFVDVRSDSFRRLQATCGTMVLPSCAEGQSGTVTVAMAYGLPCAVSRWCGFDDPGLVLLPDCRPETLRAIVRGLAERPPSEVKRSAEETLALFRRRYRPAHYAAAVRAALREVLGRAGVSPP